MVRPGCRLRLEAWAKDSSAVVVARCHMGINRGPSMAYAILLASGWDSIEAIDHIRGSRPVAAVGCAEDALDWHLRRTGADAATRLAERRRLEAWRRAHPHDTYGIIRSIRMREAA